MWSAMAKRLRSLASVLWDCDSPEDHVQYFGLDRVRERDLQLENERMKARVEQLLSEIERLKKLASMPAPCDPQNQQSCFTLDKFGYNDPWLEKLRQDVVHLPRLYLEVLPQLHETDYCNGCISFDIPYLRATASQVSQHAQRAISSLFRKHPAVFKIGITSCPAKRWANPVYGYVLDKRERWQGMKIICVTSNSFSAALVESMMISQFKDTPGCRNEKPGGETASPGEGPHFTYVVYKVLIPPPRPPQLS